jgi:ligand-binding SRPBCC domain-containing protein
MGVHKLSRKIFLPITKEKAWSFFTNPDNLSKITPPEMGFKITSKSREGAVYEGMIISYKVSPLLGIKLTWVTEITKVRHGEYFVDEQRIGPYKLWHHEHWFKEVDGGVEMEDIVHYSLPSLVPDFIFHPLLVQKNLEKIFDYRTKQMEALIPQIF